MKIETLEEVKTSLTTDVVLTEIWRHKDALSASYDHDVHQLFVQTRRREELSSYPLVSLDDLNDSLARLKVWAGNQGKPTLTTDEVLK